MTDWTKGYAICGCGHYQMQHDIENGCQVCRWEGRLCKQFHQASERGEDMAVKVEARESGVSSEKKAHPHDDFVRQIVDTAHLYGWRVAYARPARRKVKGVETYRTAWGADGKGFPDLVLARCWETDQGLDDDLLFWEVKIPPDTVKPEQQEWLELLGGRVVTPDDWDWIVKTLRGES